MMRNKVLLLQCFTVAALAVLLGVGSCAGRGLNPSFEREATDVEPATMYLSEDSGGGLVLTEDLPAGDVTLTRDSGPVSRSGGNPWREIGFWSTTKKPGNVSNEITVWRAGLCLAPSDVIGDVDKSYDIKAEVYVNGQPAGDGVSYAAKPKGTGGIITVIGGFRNGLQEGDILSLRVSARMGTDGSGNPIPGSNNSAGVTCLFDVADYPSELLLAGE